MVDCLTARVYIEDVASKKTPHCSTYERGQRMKKHIDRVLLVGAPVLVLLAFGDPLALPASVEYNTNAAQSEQPVSE